MVTKADATTSHGEMAGWWPSRHGLDGQQAMLHALDLPEPPKFLDFTLETETTR